MGNRKWRARRHAGFWDAGSWRKAATSRLPKYLCGKFKDHLSFLYKSKASSEMEVNPRWTKVELLWGRPGGRKQQQALQNNSMEI